jgi:hypothetical protein
MGTFLLTLCSQREQNAPTPFHRLLTIQTILVPPLSQAAMPVRPLRSARRARLKTQKPWRAQHRVRASALPTDARAFLAARRSYDASFIDHAAVQCMVKTLVLHATAQLFSSFCNRSHASADGRVSPQLLLAFFFNKLKLVIM